jgi:N-acetylmuramic acid 6-phosphate etherase
MAKKITESSSHYRHLDKMSTGELLENINREDQKVSLAVYRCLPQIELLVDAAFNKMKNGGRLFYIGAGTSGRLGILDASECPPTFGVPHDWVIGLMAGGDSAIRKAVEFAEDDLDLAWKDLTVYDISSQDIVIGIAASGSTPYVVHGLKKCREINITTGCVTCNPNAAIINHSDFPIVAVVGPEFVTGSTRMKSGTAQKLILNMISTSVMIKLGRVYDNRMVDMQLSNNKLVDRGIRMIRERADISQQEAHDLLVSHGSVRSALESIGYWKK